MSTSQSTRRPVPLVVDLESALLGTDLLVECVFVLAKRRPLRLLLLLLWALRGIGYFRRRLTSEAAPDAATLPYRSDIVAYLERARQAGDRLVLISRTDKALAEAAARHLGLFDAVFAGEDTRAQLRRAFGPEGFDYVGMVRIGDPIGAAVRHAIIVQPKGRRGGAGAGHAAIERVFEIERPGLAAYVGTLRPYQWTKNLLVFVPLVETHALVEPEPLLRTLAAFVAFSLCASSGYVLNDLLDLPSDRRHPHKRVRALASGRISPLRALETVPLLLAAAAAISLLLPPTFLAVLALYFVLTIGYSLRLKDVAILDVLTVAALYAMRVSAGAAAISVTPSPWLLVFCIFLFLSLAMVKRYAELMTMRLLDGPKAHARGYVLEDAELLAALGGASGYLSVLVLALWISGEASHDHHAQHWLLWGDCVLLLYWISHVWLTAHRARMDDDPLIFAIRDRVSGILLALIGLILFLASLPAGARYGGVSPG